MYVIDVTIHICSEACLKHSCLYYLAIDGSVQLENNRTVQMLIERNRLLWSTTQLKRHLQCCKRKMEQSPFNSVIV